MAKALLQLAAEDAQQNKDLPFLPINKIISPYYRPIRAEEPDTLEFDSVFESGNLAIALKVNENEYNCLLQNDINTCGHTQWFFFKVKANLSRKRNIKFNLLNLYKPKSLYQYGMRVLTLDVTNHPYTENPTEGE